MSEVTCGGFDAVAAEVALGVADAQERSDAMAHLEHCPRCRHQLGQLSGAADALLSLAPSAEPPAGFESRLLAALLVAHEPKAHVAPPQALRRLRPSPRGRRRRLVRLAAVAAAALLAAAGWFVATGSPGGSKAPVPSNSAQTGQGNGEVVTATLVAGRQSVGEVVLQTGPHPWLSMAVEAWPADLGTATVTCRVRTRDGHTVVVGSFQLAGGYGYWAAPVPVASPVTAAQLVGPGGRVVASAVLPSGRG